MKCTYFEGMHYYIHRVITFIICSLITLDNDDKKSLSNKKKHLFFVCVFPNTLVAKFLSDFQT